MATREGSRIASQLVEKGWRKKPLPPGIRRDCKLIDPKDGQEHDPHEALAIQQEREEKENV